MELALLVCFFTVTAAADPGGDSGNTLALVREKMELTGEWKFQGDKELTGAEAVDYDDQKWETVIVPHTWNNKENVTTYSAAWYRKGFDLPATDAGKRIYLYFEGRNEVLVILQRRSASGPGG